MLATSLGTALLVTDLGIIFSFLGATSSTFVSLILPGAVYYQMHSGGHTLLEDEKTAAAQPAWKLHGAAFIVVLGCLITPVCLVFLFV